MRSSQPITSSSFTVLLANNVALPQFFEVHAEIDGIDTIVVAKKTMSDQTIYFPQTTSDTWRITFYYGQPLRISELQLHQDNTIRSQQNFVRFLGQPNRNYRIYFNPDRSTEVQTTEAGNLSSSQDVFVTQPAIPKSNPYYRISDIDNDTVPDIRDNCVSTSNSDQEDINENGRGDVCDDFDQDSIVNSEDNCPDNPNLDQKDTDSDGLGDLCDGLESRLTEKYPLIPWLGMGFAGIVLIVLFIFMINTTPIKKWSLKNSLAFFFLRYIRTPVEISTDPPLLPT